MWIIKKWVRRVAIAWGPISWLYEQFVQPVVALWIEKAAERQGLGEGPPPMSEAFWSFVVGYVAPTLAYLTGPFGLGVCAGALLVSLPELPALWKRLFGVTPARSRRTHPVHQ